METEGWREVVIYTHHYTHWPPTHPHIDTLTHTDTVFCAMTFFKRENQFIDFFPNRIHWTESVVEMYFHSHWIIFLVFTRLEKSTCSMEKPLRGDFPRTQNTLALVFDKIDMFLMHFPRNYVKIHAFTSNTFNRMWMTENWKNCAARNRFSSSENRRE